MFNPDQIAPTAPVVLFKGAALNLQNHNQTIGSLADGTNGGGTVGIGGATLTTGKAGSTTFSGTFVGGTGSLVKEGANTRFTLTGKSDKFTGTLTVNEGTITLNKGQLGTNSPTGKLDLVTVKKGATLNGTKAAGARSLNVWAKKVDVKPGGTMQPGMSPGVLGIGASLNLEPGSHLSIYLAGPNPGNGPGFYSQLQLVGGGTIQGSILDLSLLAAPTFLNRYTIVENFDDNFGTSNVTPLTGIFFDEAGHPLSNGSDIFASFGGNSFDFKINYNQGPSGYDVVLTDFTPNSVPEPSSLVLLAVGGGIMLVWCARQRMRKRGIRTTLSIDTVS
jgi:hypothetical protein